MADRITRDDVAHVAGLARLALTDRELDTFTDQLAKVLDHAADVEALDLADVPPTSHPLDVVNVWAEDEPAPSLTVEEALANAPEREGSYFKVPPGGSS
jgi:aspartyl-tRNA(Asn)/glutamyl-tRNA(Gln) amidotransferase subunit C